MAQNSALYLPQKDNMATWLWRNILDHQLGVDIIEVAVLERDRFRYGICYELDGSEHLCSQSLILHVVESGSAL